MKREIQIAGMTCKACKMLIEDVCGDFSEISSPVVELDSGILTVDVSDTFDLAILKQEIESVGEFTVKI